METKNTKGRIIAGALILLVGLALLFNNFNVFDLSIAHYIFSWKTLLIGIGTVLLLAKNKLVEGIFLIGLGSIFWLPEIFQYQFALRQIFWPALLVLLGSVLLMKAFWKDNRPCGKRFKKSPEDRDVIIITESEESKW